MKRMTLLTALAMVFSLFAVTAAIAGPGPGAGEGEQAGDTLMTRTQTNDGECQGADDCPAGEMAAAQTQTRTQARTQAQDGECLAADDCPAGDQPKDQTQTQTRTQAETQAAECQADDCSADEALQVREQSRQNLTNRILAMLGAENAEVEGQYRLILNHMLQNMFWFGAMFI